MDSNHSANSIVTPSNAQGPNDAPTNDAPTNDSPISDALASDARPPSKPLVGRLAPSPTGALHVGNARSFLLAWLSARQQQGELYLRIEDIDSPRVKPWAVESTLEDLHWLGLDWDQFESATGEEYAWRQTQRMPRYRQVLDELLSRAAIYPCQCSRSDVAAAASAPHEQNLDGVVYPGTCRPVSPSTEFNGSPAPFSTQPDGKDIDGSQTAGSKTDTSPFNWRFLVSNQVQRWIDGCCGPQTLNPAKDLGDFVIAKGEGTPAYQLAVVVDDHDMGVTEVVRGDDLIYSTYRQLAIHSCLGWSPPRYFHAPLMIGPDGRRLAKRHGDTRIQSLREQGISAEAVIGYLAWTLGLSDDPVLTNPRSLVGALDWQSLPAQPTVFEYQAGLDLLRSMVA